MKICPLCETINDDNDKICYVCNTELKKQKTKDFKKEIIKNKGISILCPNCHHNIQTHGEFCPLCGYKVLDNSETKSYNIYNNSVDVLPKNKATASLVFGIISCTIGGIICAFIAIVLGVKYRKLEKKVDVENKSGSALAGFILGIIGIGKTLFIVIPVIIAILIPAISGYISESNNMSYKSACKDTLITCNATATDYVVYNNDIFNIIYDESKSYTFDVSLPEDKLSKIGSV